ncbi:MAG: nickel pincer cofactor biosynthesis protein LarC, partial [Myxococcales bacterium]|nr:nickel pincer cofactor biosynthesis protein LarC [Myxococcales bacterium]
GGHGPRLDGSLSLGEGEGGILFFDAPSGLAGDMTIAALVDLGVPEHVVTSALSALPLDGFHVHFGTRERSGIVATTFDVHVEGKQPHRTYGGIRKMLERADLPDGVRARALATFARLARAEARVHRMPLDDVHFHEVGAVDAICDVVGSAAALDYIGARVVVSPLPMGRGYTRAAHGVLPLPPPAVVECLRGFDTYDAGIAVELVTPTGAAIVAANAAGSTRWPGIAPSRTGWGAGTMELADRPNLLRVVLGRPAKGASDDATHVVLETNLDDASGELVASAVDALLAEGALDAWATPITMKKGRPALTLSALAPAARADHLSAVMLRETTSLGVRRYGVSRVERPRRMASVSTRFGDIPVKIAGGPFGPPQRKPEFDACLEAAKTGGVPVREVMQVALAASLALAFRGEE